MNLTNEAQERVQRLQLLEQNLQSLNAQKQQFQGQLFEIEGALKELADTPQAYKLVGGVMIQTTKEDLIAELSSKKELLDLRIQTFEKQETQIKEKAKNIREAVVAENNKN